MISNVKTPAALSPVDNPMIFGFQSDNIYSVEAQKAMLIIYFDRACTAGETITFSWLLRTVTLTCSYDPDNYPTGIDESGTQFRPDVNGVGVSGWIGNFLISDLMKNYYLSRDFIISRFDEDTTGKSIKIQAILPGSDYSLTSPTGAFILNVINGPGTTPVLNTNFGIIVRTLLGNNVIGEDFMTPDSSGKIEFDPAEYLKAEFDSAFSFSATACLPVIKLDLSKAYLLAYCESYGNPPTALAVSKTDAFIVLNSKIPDRKLVELSDYDSFWEFIQQTKHPLTWHPGNKKIFKTQHERISFLCCKQVNAGEKLILNLQLNFTDGTVDTRTVSDPFDALIGEVFDINVSYSQLDIENIINTDYAGKILECYYVWILNNTTSEIVLGQRKYIINYKNYYQQREIIFRNSFNCYESVIVTGDASKTGAYTRTTANVITKNGYSLKKQTDVDSDEVMKVNTGYLTKKEIDWLDDLFESDDVYEMIDGKLHPINITSTKLTKYSDSDDLNSVEFEYEYKYFSEAAIQISEADGGILVSDSGRLLVADGLLYGAKRTYELESVADLSKNPDILLDKEGWPEAKRAKLNAVSDYFKINYIYPVPFSQASLNADYQFIFYLPEGKTAIGGFWVTPDGYQKQVDQLLQIQGEKVTLNCNDVIDPGCHYLNIIYK